MRDLHTLRARARRSFPLILLAAAAALSFAPQSRAQSQSSLERFERTLEQIRRDTTLKVDASVPAGQRLLLDYGGFLQAGYLSLADTRNDNHVLRQYLLPGYVRANL